MSEPVTYGTYLQLDKILQAQRPPGPDGRERDLHHHDEMLFIVIHQTYELWFKQILHEVSRVRDILTQDPVPEPEVAWAVKSLGRVREIQRILVSQISVLETMSPMGFLAFRGELGAASGFQSAQFRVLELTAGLRDEMRYEYAGDSFERRLADADRAHLNSLRGQTNLRVALEQWLARTPIEDGFVEMYLDRFETYLGTQRALHEDNDQLDPAERDKTLARLDQYRDACRTFLTGDNAAVHAACLFITAYREEPLLHWPNRLLDSLLEFEELLRRWRFRHARMVERMIGLRVGTGGSSGVEYLDATAGDRYRIFTTILESRSFLVPRTLLPDLQSPEKYGFHR